MSHLSPKQTRAIEALLVEHDQTAAAAACGINRRTLSRWLATPEFRESYQRASAALLWDTLARLRISEHREHKDRSIVNAQIGAS
jgi:hypothetical protein